MGVNMYKWDLERIDEDLKNTNRVHPQFFLYKSVLFKEAISGYVENINGTTLNTSYDEDYFFKFVLENFKKYLHLYEQNKKLFLKINKAKPLEPSKTSEIDHDFELDEVFDICRSFLYSINNYFGFQIDAINDDKRIALNKSITKRGSFFPDFLSENHYIGINARNKEEMAFSLVHEMGHLIENSITTNPFSETFPILLELYLNEYIQKNKINYDTIPHLNARFVLNRNAELESIKEYLKVSPYSITEKDVNDIITNFYKSKGINLLGFDTLLKYFISAEKALDIYERKRDVNKATSDLMRSESIIHDISSFIKNTPPNIIGKEKTIKRLLKK